MSGGRRWIPRFASLLALLATALGTPSLAIDLQWTPIAEGLDAAGLAASPATDDDRLFVVAREGRVWIVRDATEGSGTPALLNRAFLDIRDRVKGPTSPGSELGLLSIAFHPDHATNGFVFAVYTDLEGDGVVSRFQVLNDPNRASAATERVLLRIPQFGDNHNVDHVAFGPDGMLYVSAGDGGYLREPRCTGQQGDVLLGKVLRLDVDRSVDGTPYHRVPADNPFVGDPSVRDEVWSLGLRNPWRFSFDRATGDLWLTDVGHDLREEVNFVAAGTGGGQNWGFKRMEGFACRGSDENCIAPVPGCFDPAYSDPAVDYAHDDRHCAIIGGHVLRDPRIPALDGTYVAGDFCGAVSLVTRDPVTGAFSRTEADGDLPRARAFAEHAAGTLFVLADGVVYRLDGATGADRVAFIADTFPVSESAGEVEVTVTRSGGAGAAQVMVESIFGTAGAADIGAVSTLLTWGDREDGPRAVTLPVFDDTSFEGEERLDLVLRDPVGTSLGARATAQVVITDDEQPGSSCVPSDTALCLGDRFRVTVPFRDHGGQQGMARTVPELVDLGFGSSGLLWFFDRSNLEMLVKVLDGCAFNGHFWVYLAAATDVEYTVRVLDTVTGATRAYPNPAGTLSPAQADVEAFVCDD